MLQHVATQALVCDSLQNTWLTKRPKQLLRIACAQVAAFRPPCNGMPF